MKKYGTILAVSLIISGCSLNKQVPKATISFDPVTHQFNIASHKDVVMSNVNVSVTASNTDLKIGYYSAAANVEVIKAAVEAQQNQIKGANDGLITIVNAISGGAKAIAK